MTLLILLRHGQSEWNKRNLFTGWVDVPLSKQGIEEALKAGREIADLPIDVIFTTPLIRASMTAMLAMSEHSSGKVPVIIHSPEEKMGEWGKIHSEAAMKEIIPVYVAWQLNERMYGHLQGYNKAETAEKYGAEQVKIWRRSYDVKPPEGECLETTASRSIPFFEERVVPFLREGKNVFISAHGNSLRSIMMHLEGLSKEEVLHLELPTGEPVLYDYAKGAFTRRR